MRWLMGVAIIAVGCSVEDQSDPPVDSPVEPEPAEWEEAEAMAAQAIAKQPLPVPKSSMTGGLGPEVASD